MTRSLSISALIGAALLGAAVQARAGAIQVECLQGATTVRAEARTASSRPLVVDSEAACPAPGEAFAQDVNGTNGDSASARTSISLQDGVFELAVDVAIDAPTSISARGIGLAELEAGVLMPSGPGPTIDIQLVLDLTGAAGVQVVFGYIQGPGPTTGVALDTASGDIVQGLNVFDFEVGAGSRWFLEVIYGFGSTTSATSSLSVSLVPEPSILALLSLALLAGRRARPR